MALLLADQVRLGAPPARVWEVLDDPDRLARILPGCESLRRTGPADYAGTFRAPLQFLTLRIRASTALRDLDLPRHVRLVIEGEPDGLAGSFVVSIPVDLEAADEGCVARYSIDLRVTGRLATFGQPILRHAVALQVAELRRNLEAELAGTGGGE